MFSNSPFYGIRAAYLKQVDPYFFFSDYLPSNWLLMASKPQRVQNTPSTYFPIYNTRVLIVLFHYLICGFKVQEKVEAMNKVGGTNEIMAIFLGFSLETRGTSVYLGATILSYTDVGWPCPWVGVIFL